jgi:hypothetical protein
MKPLRSSSSVLTPCPQVDSWADLPLVLAQAPSSSTALAAVTAQRIALRRWLDNIKSAHRNFLLGLLRK